MGLTCKGPLIPRRFAPLSPRCQRRAWRATRLVCAGCHFPQDSCARPRLSGFCFQHYMTRRGVRTLSLQMLASSSASTLTTRHTTGWQAAASPKPYRHRHQSQVAHQHDLAGEHHFRRPAGSTNNKSLISAVGLYRSRKSLWRSITAQINVLDAAWATCSDHLVASIERNGGRH